MALPYNIRQDKLYDTAHIMSNMEYLKNIYPYPAYTTLDREALSVSMGTIVYDTTVLNLFSFNGTNWVEM